MWGKVVGLFYFLLFYIIWSGKFNFNWCGVVLESFNNRLEFFLMVKDVWISFLLFYKLILGDKWGLCFMWY